MYWNSGLGQITLTFLFNIQRNLLIMTAFFPPRFCHQKKFAAIKNPNMYQYDKWWNVFIPLFTPRNIRFGYLLESPRWGDYNKYPQHMFLGILNTVFLNISNYLHHLELRNRSIQNVIVTNFVVILNVGIKRFDCIMLYCMEIELAFIDWQFMIFPFLFAWNIDC